MEQWVKEAAVWLALVTEGIASIVIGIAVLEAGGRSAMAFLWHRRPDSYKQTLRLQLGRWLAVALEFLLAADILRTAVTPTWNEIGQLAAIIFIRTLLNFFLGREIEKEAKTIVPETGRLAT